MIQLASLKVKVKSLSFVSDSANPWAIQARILEWVAFPFSRGSSQPKPGIKPRSPALQVDSLPAEPQGKPKNTGVNNLSHLQGIFPTQELNWGLLYCRRILYQLSYQGSPLNFLSCFYILEINHLSLASFTISGHGSNLDVHQQMN